MPVNWFLYGFWRRKTVIKWLMSYIHPHGFLDKKVILKQNIMNVSEVYLNPALEEEPKIKIDFTGNFEVSGKKTIHHAVICHRLLFLL